MKLSIRGAHMFKAGQLEIQKYNRKDKVKINPDKQAREIFLFLDELLDSRTMFRLSQKFKVIP